MQNIKSQAGNIQIRNDFLDHLQIASYLKPMYFYLCCHDPNEDRRPVVIIPVLYLNEGLLMKSFQYLFTIILIAMGFLHDAGSCTTAVISGQYTPDGRPLLLKHRDSDFLQNKLMYFNDGKYTYIGLVNAEDSSGKEVWGGCNSTGFAIINSAAYNLNIGDSTKLMDQEGVIMKKALQNCASLQDFENLLLTLPKPLGSDANFGVIDARGGAAYYETGNFTFTRIDANDPRTAPFGYLIRTNHAFTGKSDAGAGYIRYATAEDLFYQASATHNLSHEFLLRDVSRCLKHSLTKIDLWQNLPDDKSQARFVSFRDFIPRNSSTSSMVIQGITGKENPALTTMWTILGFPLCSVAIPVWIAGGASLPDILIARGADAAPLCDLSLQLKKYCFPITRGNGSSYLNLSALINQQQSGILQKLQPLESLILTETRHNLELWRKEGEASAKIQKFYDWLDEKIRSEYKNLFNLSF